MLLCIAMTYYQEKNPSGSPKSSPFEQEIVLCGHFMPTLTQTTILRNLPAQHFLHILLVLVQLLVHLSVVTGL